MASERDPRLKRAGVSGFNKPKRTPSHPKKSHVVVAKEGDKVKGKDEDLEINKLLKKGEAAPRIILKSTIKNIIRNQRKRARDREKAKIEAALKLQRMQKARANWLKANNLDEEMLMKLKDPVEFLSALRLEHDYAKHPAFKGYDSKLRQTHEADKVHPCYYWYDESQHVVWHNKKNSRGRKCFSS